jgi:hypothetical protein
MMARWEIFLVWCRLHSALLFLSLPDALCARFDNFVLAWCCACSALLTLSLPEPLCALHSVNLVLAWCRVCSALLTLFLPDAVFAPFCFSYSCPCLMPCALHFVGPAGWWGEFLITYWQLGYILVTRWNGWLQCLVLTSILFALLNSCSKCEFKRQPLQG